MKGIYQKSMGVNPATGLEDQIVVWQLTIDAQAEKIVVVYCVQTISPTGVVVAIGNNQVFERYNRPDILFAKDEIITPAVLDADGKETTPAIIAKGDEVKVKGNMKFDQLKASQVGQMIAGMIKLDIDSIKGLDTANEDLEQY